MINKMFIRCSDFPIIYIVLLLFSGYYNEIEAKDARQILELEPLETCGKRPAISNSILNKNLFSSHDLTPDTMIAGGVKAGFGHFPSYAFLTGTTEDGGYNKSTSCGGVLVGPKVVITAAHCLYMFKWMHELKIELGRNGPQRWTKTYKIEKICHEDDHCLMRFPNSDEKTLLPIKDFAILQLSEKVVYNNYVQPACLSYDLDSYYKSNDQDHFETAGMGWLNNYGESPSNLLYTTMSRDCSSQIVDNYRKANPLIQCYKSVAKSNLCQGDSGGPMYYYRKLKNKSAELRQFLAAETSFGINDCRSISYPVGFTDVEGYEDKIKKIMDEKVCYNMILKNPTKPLHCDKING